MEDFLQQEEMLMGLALLEQLFNVEHDPRVARAVDQLYHGHEKDLFKTVIAVASLCLQKYAVSTGLAESDVIAAVRDDLLSGKTSLE